MTTLTTVTSERLVPTVSRIAAAVCSLVSVSPERRSSRLRLAVTTTAASGISTSRLNQIIATPSPRPDAAREPSGGAAGRRRAPAVPGAATAVGHSPLPESAMILVTMPVVLVEELRRTASLQPPKSSSTVSRFVDRRERVGRIVGALDLADVDAVDRPGGSP